jgi:hypothetical protein
MADETFQLWARSPDEVEPSLRRTGEQWPLEVEAERLAKASGDEGVMSVWVQNDRDGGVVWSAGEKATELELPDAH